MTDQTTITLSDEDLAFAEELVRDGLFSDVEAAVSGAMRKLRRDMTPSSDPLAGMADEIRARAETPLEEFVDFNPEAERAHFRALAAKRIAERQAAE